jgi:2-polyprenyl-3-methyl-5-hydroxy-6-metoxy-1,4-benzoquinol methylase
MLETNIPHGLELYHETTTDATDVTPIDSNESEWFASFLRHTDQKKLTSKALAELIAKYETQANITDGVKILDIGCGEGELSERVVNSFKKNWVHSYCGIDSDADFISQINEKFKEKAFQTRLLTTDCFDMNYKELGKYNFILASNILYYCKDIPSYFSSILPNLDDQGMLVFIHENSTSTPKAMRKKYLANIAGDIPDAIKCGAEKNDVFIKEYSVSSSITFDTNITLLLRSIKTHQDSTLILGIKNCLLLEFIVQTSLQDLERKGVLIAYFSDIEKVLIENDNRIPIVSRIQVVCKQPLEI